ncbi:hypothetical protein GOODEAATRI_033869 [Goodea atripinnis]|uniref:Uncharacterized protein n=1 Tax=Goodea atripinnis TaxID=208336 RepID=A0ABV0NZU6_9TELE
MAQTKSGSRHPHEDHYIEARESMSSILPSMDGILFCFRSNLTFLVREGELKYLSEILLFLQCSSWNNGIVSGPSEAKSNSLFVLTNLANTFDSDFCMSSKYDFIP